MNCSYCRDEACTCLTIPQFAVLVLAVCAVVVGVCREDALLSDLPRRAAVVAIDCDRNKDLCAALLSASAVSAGDAEEE